MKVKKIFYKFSSLIILALMALSLYQVDRLWLEEATGQSFLTSLFSQNAPLFDVSYYKYFRQPKRIITRVSYNRFDIAYSNLAENSSLMFFDEVILEILQNGQFRGTFELDYDVLNNDIIIYEYAFIMNSSTFAEVYSQRNNVILAIERFDAVYILEDRVYFVDSENNLMHRYTVSAAVLNAERLLAEISQAKNNSSISYASSRLLELNTEKNLFFPIWQNGEYSVYNPIRIRTSYYQYGDLTKANLLRNIRFLFDNPESVWDTTDISERLTFSNNHAVVRYLENDIVDFTNYRVNQQNRGASFLDDFAQAISFIKADNMMVNEIYLMGYEEIGSIRTFYFGYVHNNQRILLTDHDFGIAVTVIGGTLTRYRKLAYTFETATEVNREARRDILSILDEMEAGGLDIARINFGYRVPFLEKDEYGKQLGLTIGIVDIYGYEIYLAPAIINTEPEF
ncbi:MAG: hypothetical protein FWD82_07315 [Defluviitaleaceae bacterium]|nr:hypothetical protein [Defluviitaleaceae bacterium]